MNIKVIVGEYEYVNTHIIKFSLDKSAQNISHTFELQLKIPKYLNYEEYKKVVIVKNQQEVKFLINDKVFLLGIAEKIQINEKGNEIILSGRSKMILLVNGQGIIKEYYERNLVKLFAQVFKDNNIDKFQIDNTTSQMKIVNNIGTKLKNIPSNVRIIMKKEDTIFSFIDRYAIICRCVAISDNEGNLLLTRESEKAIDDEQGQDGFEIRVLVNGEGESNAHPEGYVCDFTNRVRYISMMSQNHTAYMFDGANNGKNTKTKPFKVIIDDQVTLPTMRRHEYKVGADGEVLAANAEWILNRKRAESQKVSVSLGGKVAEVFLSKNPELLQLVKTTNQYAQIENENLVIAEMSVSISNDTGLVVKLGLVPTNSYTFAPDSKTFLQGHNAKIISAIEPPSQPKLILQIEPRIKRLDYDPITPYLEAPNSGNFSAGNFEATQNLLTARNLQNKKYSK